MRYEKCKGILTRRTLEVSGLKDRNETVCACDADDATKARALVRAGRRRHFAEAPAIRLCGPLIQEAYVAGLSHKSLLRTGSAIDDDIVDRLSTFR